MQLQHYDKCKEFAQNTNRENMKYLDVQYQETSKEYLCVLQILKHSIDNDKNSKLWSHFDICGVMT